MWYFRFLRVLVLTNTNIYGLLRELRFGLLLRFCVNDVAKKQILNEKFRTVYDSVQELIFLIFLSLAFEEKKNMLRGWFCRHGTN